MAPSGRQSGRKDARRVDAVVGHLLADHLPDRQRFTVPALDVAGLEPVEASIGIVGLVLFGQEEGESVPVGECGPACAVIVACRGLCAAVQDDDECGFGRELWRQVAAKMFVTALKAHPGYVFTPAYCHFGRTNPTGISPTNPTGRKAHAFMIHFSNSNPSSPKPTDKRLARRTPDQVRGRAGRQRSAAR